MNKAFGTTQVLEVVLSKEDVAKIVIENLQTRCLDSYDFDYNHPIVIWEKDCLILRYVQKKVTLEREPQNFYLKPMPTQKG